MFLYTELTACFLHDQVGVGAAEVCRNMYNLVLPSGVLEIVEK